MPQRLMPLAAVDLPLGRALGYSVYTAGGVLLLRRGLVVQTEEDRDRIMAMGPHRDAAEPPAPTPRPATARPSSTVSTTPRPKPQPEPFVDPIPDVKHTVEYVQMLVPVNGTQQREATNASFLGKLGHHALMVSAPDLGEGRSWGLCVGMTVTLRVACQRRIYQFDTEIVSAHHHPLPYLVLKYPNAARQGVFRKEARIQTSLLASLEVGAAAPPLAVNVVDLSGLGCAFDAPSAVGQPGSAAVLHLTANIGGAVRKLSLPLTVRNLPPSGQAGVIRHGASFGADGQPLDQMRQMLLKAYICESLLSGQASEPPCEPQAAERAADAIEAEPAAAAAG